MSTRRVHTMRAENRGKAPHTCQTAALPPGTKSTLCSRRHAGTEAPARWHRLSARGRCPCSSSSTSGGSSHGTRSVNVWPYITKTSGGSSSEQCSVWRTCSQRLTSAGTASLHTGARRATAPHSAGSCHWGRRTCPAHRCARCWTSCAPTPAAQPEPPALPCPWCWARLLFLKSTIPAHRPLAPIPLHPSHAAAPRPAAPASAALGA